MEDIRKGVCPLCRHNEVLERRSTPEGFRETYAAQEPAYLPPAKTTVAYGAVHRYICLGCGFSQEFAQSPKLLPMTKDDRVIKGSEPVGPYR